MRILALLVILLFPAMATAQDQSESSYTDSDQERILLEAIRNRDHDAVNALLTNGVNANAHEEGGWTALMSAAETGQADLAKALLAAGADADAKDKRGWTALMVALQRRHKAVADALLAAGADPTIDLNVCPTCLTGGQPRTFTPVPIARPPIVPLFDAVKKGDADQVKLLLDQGADVNAKKSSWRSGETALELAASEGHLDVVTLLLERGADVRIRWRKGPLFLAASKGHLDVVTLLLDQGALVLDQGADGSVHGIDLEVLNHAALEAIRGGHLDVVTLLLDRGADVNEPNDDGITWLMGAVMVAAGGGNNLDMVTLLLERGADVNPQYTKYTPLMMAAAMGNLDLVTLLLERGADVNRVDYPGLMTAGMVARQEGHTEIAEMLSRLDAAGTLARTLNVAAEQDNMSQVVSLVEQGAEVNAIGRGRTPLMWVVHHGHPEIVPLLLERGADVNVRDDRGFTALIMAAYRGDLDTVTLLLDRGADVNARTDLSSRCNSPFVRHAEKKALETDACDMTALETAAYEGHLDVVTLLLERSADETVQEIVVNALRLALVEGHGEIAAILDDALRSSGFMPSDRE